MADPDYYLGAPIVVPAGGAATQVPAPPVAAPAGEPDYYLGAPVVVPAKPPPAVAKPDAAASSWEPDWLRTLSEGGASGMTFGLSDIVGAAGAATGGALRRALPPPDWLRAAPAGAAPATDGGSWGQDFRNRLAEYRSDAAEHPYANLIGTLAGAAGGAGTLSGASGAALPASLPAVPTTGLASAGPFAARPLAAANLATAPSVLPPAAATPGLLARTLAGGAGGAAGGAVTGWAGSDDPLSPDLQTLKQAALPAAAYGVAGGALPAVGAAAAPVLRAVEPYASTIVPHGLGLGAGGLIQHLTGIGGEGGMFAAPFVGERALTPALAKLWDATAGGMMRSPTALSSIGGVTGATIPAVGQAVTPWWATPGAGATP